MRVIKKCVMNILKGVVMKGCEECVQGCLCEVCGESVRSLYEGSVMSV